MDDTTPIPTPAADYEVDLDGAYDWCDVCDGPVAVVNERAEPIPDETQPFTVVYDLACGHTGKKD